MLWRGWAAAASLHLLKSPAAKLTLCLSPARVSKDRSILQVLSRNTGAWSCICHDHFNLVLAKAACEQMGYRRYKAAFSTLLMPTLSIRLPQNLFLSEALYLQSTQSSPLMVLVHPCHAEPSVRP